MPATLALLRHGSSTANEEKRFGGWWDVPLTQNGINQAYLAGEILKKSGISFDVVYTSMLTRAISTAWHCTDALDQVWLPVIKDWRLNERHYGALQGKSKSECILQHGADRVLAWRRSYRAVPPALDPNDVRDSWGDSRYRNLERKDVPLTESLYHTYLRVMTTWTDAILPDLRAGKNTLVVAHGNSIRALLMAVEGLDEETISMVEVPNAIPILYSFDVESGIASKRASLL